MPGLVDRYGRPVEYLRDAKYNSKWQVVKPLLSVNWVDVTGTAFDTARGMTAQQVLAEILEEEMLDAYETQIKARQGQFEDSTSPLNMQTEQAIREMARATAGARLERYQKDLTKFLDGKPSEDEIVDWLAKRAMSDARIWAGIDGTAMKKKADDDFYQANPDLRRNASGYTVLPETAVCGKCQAIAGQTYPTFDAVQAALDDAWHFNCVHSVQPISDDTGKVARVNLVKFNPNHDNQSRFATIAQEGD